MTATGILCLSLGFSSPPKIVLSKDARINIVINGVIKNGMVVIEGSRIDPIQSGDSFQGKLNPYPRKS